MTREEKQRAFDAGSVLNNPVFNEVWEDMDRRIVSEWRNSQDAVRREECWMTMKALIMLKKNFMSILQDAAMREGGKDESLNTVLKAVKTRKVKKTGDKE